MAAFGAKRPRAKPFSAAPPPSRPFSYRNPQNPPSEDEMKEDLRPDAGRLSAPPRLEIVHQAVRGRIVRGHGRVVLQLRQNRLRKLLASSTPHWSNELMFQMMPWTKILCSYIAISEPSVRGVIFWTRIEFVGRLPLNTLCGTSLSSASSCIPCAVSSERTSSAVLPRISASVCAKKFESRIAWCSPIGL